VVMRTAGFQRRGDFDVGFASDDLMPMVRHGVKDDKRIESIGISGKDHHQQKETM
jgi:hypothetical protein